MRKNEMNAKKLLVSFLLVASLLFLATAVSAATTTDATVYIDGVKVATYDGATTLENVASVIAGEKIEVKVRFTADEKDSQVRIKATLEGDKSSPVAYTYVDADKVGVVYQKTLVLQIPSELKDVVSDDLVLELEIGDAELDDIVLNVQRPSYDFAVKSVSTSNSIKAGQSMPVEVVLKNVGYNEADDVYVTVSIPELNIKKSAYLGDIAALDGQRTYKYKFGDDEDYDFVIEVKGDEDDEDTVSGKLYLDVPYTAKSGVYTLVVEVSNDDITNPIVRREEVTIENGVSDLVLRSENDLVVLNPTSQLKVYTVKYNDKAVTIVVPAGSSKNVAIEVPTGEYNFDVAVYSGETVLSTVNFSGSSQETVALTNPVFVLTIILSVVFLVLLVVLVVLITKKPQKAEEFGESYY